MMTRTIYKLSTALVLVFNLCAFPVRSDSAEVFCPAGHYLQSGTCKPCDLDQYMNLTNHQMLQCYWCTKLRIHTPEYVVKNCTPYADTVIRCKVVQNNKYFWRESRRECKLCDPCISEFKPYIGKDCGPTEDSICCEDDDMVVVDGKCEQSKTTTPRFTTVNSTTNPRFTTANSTVHENTVFENTTFKEEDKESNNDTTSPKPLPEVGKSKIMRITLGLVLGFGIPLAVLVILFRKREKILEKFCSRNEKPKVDEDESSGESLV